MPTTNRLKAAWLAAFLLLVTASLSQGVEANNAFGLDTLFHIGIYAALSAIPLIVVKKRFMAFILALATAPLGFVFESLHGSVSGYGFKMLDAFYNNVGILIGLFFGIVIRLKKHFRQENSQEPTA